MNWKVHLSWIVLVVGGFCGIHISETKPPSGNHLKTALFSAYIFWALYWGVPAVWQWTRRTRAARFLSILNILPLGGVFQALLSFIFLFMGGYFYSVLGGGIYQFVKHVRGSTSFS